MRRTLFILAGFVIVVGLIALFASPLVLNYLRDKAATIRTPDKKALPNASPTPKEVNQSFPGSHQPSP